MGLRSAIRWNKLSEVCSGINGNIPGCGAGLRFCDSMETVRVKSDTNSVLIEKKGCCRIAGPAPGCGMPGTAPSTWTISFLHELSHHCLECHQPGFEIGDFLFERRDLLFFIVQLCA